MPVFDSVAELYDETRGGEARGDEYADDLAVYLPDGEGPILEVGVGTGVVALGLVRRGRRVIGLDVSKPMLSKARARLGPIVIAGDAMEMPLGTGSVAHAVSVWVIHTVVQPQRLFAEVARVLRRTGRYVVCTTQRPAPDNELGRIVDRMGDDVDARRPARRGPPRRLSASQILEWGAAAGFTGEVQTLHRAYHSRPSHELDKIARRAWPSMRDLDDEALAAASEPAVVALRALPERDYLCRVTSELVLLQRSSVE